MATYLHPGVYIEEIPSGSKPIEGVATSVAAFVGPSSRGPAGIANRIGRFDDYETDYGGILTEDDHMGLALQAFYLNGGKAAYVCRLAGDGSEAAHTTMDGEGAHGGGATTDPVLTISASSVGDWGNVLYYQIVKPDVHSLTFDLLVGHLQDGKFEVDEEFTDVNMVADDSDYALTTVNRDSNLVRLALAEAADPDDAGEQYQQATLTGGKVGATATFFSALAWPLSMTVVINDNNPRQVTVNPTGFTDVNGADGDVVAGAIQQAIHDLSADAAFLGVTCTYNSGSRRFSLVSAEPANEAAKSQVWIGVEGGELGQKLHLGHEDALANKHVAELQGTAMGSGATVFATGTPAVARAELATTLTLDIDGLGTLDITLDAASLGLEKNNSNDGGSIALAIQNAVRAADTSIPSYKDFSCTYNSSRQFIMRSGTDHVRESDITATGALATFLQINAAVATLIEGRQREQGTARVIPLENLGPNDAGIPLQDGAYQAPTANDYGDFYANILRKVRDVSILVVPGQHWAEDGSGNPVIAQTLAHCESTASRVLIIDPPPATELDQAAAVSRLSLPTSTYSTLYYPWLDVANPFYHEEKAPDRDRFLRIAPSAFAAGMWSKIDGKRGVWKAPAGVEAQLNGVAGLEYDVEDLEQDALNPLGVNCIRKLPSYGSVFWGSRSLATRADPEWRYIPVRRTAIFLEQSIYNGIQWAVFEPNDHPLWSSLKANIGSFMNGLFRSGAFQGVKSKDAYFVRCGLGDTMTQGDIDAGQVIVQVGFAPLKPAEFVIVRIQQKVAQQ